MLNFAKPVVFRHFCSKSQKNRVEAKEKQVRPVVHTRRFSELSTVSIMALEKAENFLLSLLVRLASKTFEKASVLGFCPRPPSLPSGSENFLLYVTHAFLYHAFLYQADHVTF